MDEAEEDGMMQGTSRVTAESLTLTPTHAGAGPTPAGIWANEPRKRLRQLMAHMLFWAIVRVFSEHSLRINQSS